MGLGNRLLNCELMFYNYAAIIIALSPWAAHGELNMRVHYIDYYVCPLFLPSIYSFYFLLQPEWGIHD